MRRRLAGLLGILLLTSTGCSSLSSYWPGSASPANPPPLNADAHAALRSPAGSSDESAKLCITVADDLEKAGHVREAALQIELARQYKPNLNISARLAHLYQATAEGAQPREQMLYFQKAVVEYQKALAAGPASAELLNDMGYCYYQKNDAAEAEHCFRQALEKNPKLQRAWTNLGLALGAQGKETAALAAFAQVVSPAEAHCNLAYVYLKQGRADIARQQYVLALQRNPNLKLAQERLSALDSITASVQTAAAVTSATKGDAHVGPADWRASTTEQTQLGLGAPQKR